MIRPPPVLPARRRRRGTRPAFRGHAAASRASPLAGVPSLRARRATPAAPAPAPAPGAPSGPSLPERDARAPPPPPPPRSSVAASAASRGSTSRASASATAALEPQREARVGLGRVGDEEKGGDVADVAVFSNAQTRRSNANASDDSANESASASRSRSVHDALPRSLANRPAPSAHSCARGAHARTASAVAPARWSVLFLKRRAAAPSPSPSPSPSRNDVVSDAASAP